MARKAFIEVKDADLDVIVAFGGIKTPKANFIGQIASWRRLLGDEAMKYN